MHSRGNKEFERFNRQLKMAGWSPYVGGQSKRLWLQFWLHIPKGDQRWVLGSYRRTGLPFQKVIPRSVKNGLDGCKTRGEETQRFCLQCTLTKVPAGTDKRTGTEQEELDLAALSSWFEEKTLLCIWLSCVLRMGLPTNREYRKNDRFEEKTVSLVWGYRIGVLCSVRGGNAQKAHVTAAWVTDLA